ncbi:signal peptide peptidase SppA, partial [Bacteroidota bacterium]
NKEFTRDRIAVVYASGTIGMGEGREGSIGAKRISRAIVKARRNSKVKAIVIRVNSGGDVLSSEIIWREVLLASKSKPVIASMGDYAASGGYYILSPVSKIVAGKNTLTGSIGVFGVLFTTKKLMNNKLGITVDGVQTNKNSGTGSVFRPFTEYEKKVLQASVDDTYSTFLDRVAEGRNMNRDEVDKIGQGRIWTGEDAKKIGLIDEFGGLEKAISIAAEEAGIENYRLLELPALTDPFTALLNSIGSFSKLKQFKNPLFENFNPAETMEDLFELKGLQLRIPYKFEVY